MILACRAPSFLPFGKDAGKAATVHGTTAANNNKQRHTASRSPRGRACLTASAWALSVSDVPVATPGQLVPEGGLRVYCPHSNTNGPLPPTHCNQPTMAAKVLACAGLLFAASRMVTASVPEAEPVVQAVGEEDFKAFTTTHPKFLALMHSPWDATCKKAVRDFTAAAHASQRILEDRGDAKVVFVTVDCSSSSRLCQRFGATGFPPPRLGIFNLTSPVLKEKVVFSDAKAQIYTQHFYETLALTLRDDSTDFTQNFERMEVGPHHIRHLDRSSIDEYDKANLDSAMLVLFYSHGCGHSGNFLPQYAAESNRAAAMGLNVRFTSVNCGRPGNNEYCSRVGVSRYPSVKFFSQADDAGARSGSASGAFVEDITADSDLIVFLQSKGVDVVAALPRSDEL